MMFIMILGFERGEILSELLEERHVLDEVADSINEQERVENY
jgi:hypothetical protein